MKSYITTPGNNEIVAIKNIIAIRKREPLPDLHLGPALLIDYVYGNNQNTIIVKLENKEEVDKLMSVFELAIRDFEAHES